MMTPTATDKSSPAPTTAANGDDAATPLIVDVWSRTHPKYRIRAFVLLAVNVLLFAGVGSFAFWLRSGVWFAPLTQSYWDQLEYTFLGVGNAEVSLGSLLLNPINVQDVPMQIPIIALLMAALISIPILVAVLYRFWASLPFIAVVGLLAVMPWLALTLLASCAIASVRPFKTQFRFVSALMGLAPVVLYFILAWSGSTEMIAGKIDPVERIKFIAPWVMAIVAASVVFALVLSIARMVDYRPGAITPLLAIMFGLPVALFEANVGRDELYYRLLESLDRGHFTDVDATQSVKLSAIRKWETHPPPRPTWEEILAREVEKWVFELASVPRPFHSELTRHQVEITRRCDWFRLHFPDSRYALNALFIKARALDMRVDTAAFRSTRWIRFYDEFPAGASRETWRLIYENAPVSPPGTVATLRLAQLDARNGHVDHALDLLGRLLLAAGEDANTDDVPEPTDGTLWRFLSRGVAEESLLVSLDGIMIQAHRLHDLLAENRDPIYGYDPLCGSNVNDAEHTFGLLDLDIRNQHYESNLRQLKQWYPDCQIEDNIDLELARLAPDLETRISRLRELIVQFARRDAVPEAMLRLGLAYRDSGQPNECDRTLAELMSRYPATIWAAQAATLAPRTAWTRLPGARAETIP